jgi:hypothetical protein
MGPPDAPLLLRVTEAARLLGVSGSARYEPGGAHLGGLEWQDAP